MRKPRLSNFFAGASPPRVVTVPVWILMICGAKPSSVDSRNEAFSPLPIIRVLLGASGVRLRPCRDVMLFHCCFQEPDSCFQPAQVSMPEQVTRMSSAVAMGTSPGHGA